MPQHLQHLRAYFLLWLVGDALWNATAYRLGARCCGFQTMLPHLHLQSVHRVPLLEYAVSCGAQHVPSRAVLQPPSAAQSIRARPASRHARPLGRPGEIIPVLKNQRENPDYVFVPELPNVA